MPADSETEAFRAASILVAAQTADAVARLLPNLYDFADPLASFDAYRRRVIPLVAVAAKRNAGLARRDYFRVRTLAEAEGSVEWQPVALQPEVLARSLFATAFTTLQGIETAERPELMRRAQTQAGGTVVRSAMNGARNSTIATTQVDPAAIGAVYINHPDGQACYWCKMLASRGPVYKGNSFDESDKLFSGGGTAKTHDFCRCVIRNVYAKDTAVLDDAREMYGEWRSVTKGVSGKAKVLAWRRHLAGR